MTDPQMPERLRFSVHGVAAPQGSKRFVGYQGGRGRMIESSKRVGSWRSQIANRAAELMVGCLLMDGPLELLIAFYLPRPKGHQGAHGIRPSAPHYPTTYPDLSKLVRALEDALTGVVWRDDSLLVKIDARKWYADRRVPMVVIDIRTAVAETQGEWDEAAAEVPA